MLKESKDTQEINSVGSSNDTMSSDFSTPHFHAINDGSSVISNSISYDTILHFIVYNNVCAFYM